MMLGDKPCNGDSRAIIIYETYIADKKDWVITERKEIYLGRKGFDRDKFANDFEEEHGWCPDAGYEEAKSTDDRQEMKEAYEYMKRIKTNPKDITVSCDGGNTWYRDGKEIKSE